jgi:ribosomal protein S21
MYAAGATPMQVLVRDNNIDQALRVLKKKMQRKACSAK